MSGGRAAGTMTRLRWIERWKARRQRRREFPKGCTCNDDGTGHRLNLWVGCPVHD